MVTGSSWHCELWQNSATITMTFDASWETLASRWHGASCIRTLLASRTTRPLAAAPGGVVGDRAGWNSVLGLDRVTPGFSTIHSTFSLHGGVVRDPMNW